jgi:dTDP-4-dehydrorhamnose reductase
MGDIDIAIQSRINSDEKDEFEKTNTMEIRTAMILGHRGMLGHMVAKYFAGKYACAFVDAKFPSEEFKDAIKNFKGDYIINCVGAIPQKTNTFDINYDLPVWLSENAKCKVIHPGTDCEMDDDPYGVSKKRASDYIKAKSVNTKIIKASIIGPEIETAKSLLYWFLNSTGEVKGYKNAMWNGITTLEWAKICQTVMLYWPAFEKETIVQSDCVSKYDILCSIKEVYQKDINIIPFENKRIDKCLNGTILTKSIKEQLIEMKSYYEGN